MEDDLATLRNKPHPDAPIPTARVQFQTASKKSFYSQRLRPKTHCCLHATNARPHVLVVRFWNNLVLPLSVTTPASRAVN